MNIKQLMVKLNPLNSSSRGRKCFRKALILHLKHISRCYETNTSHLMVLFPWWYSSGTKRFKKKKTWNLSIIDKLALESDLPVQIRGPALRCMNSQNASKHSSFSRKKKGIWWDILVRDFVNPQKGDLATLCQIVLFPRWHRGPRLAMHKVSEY